MRNRFVDLAFAGLTLSSITMSALLVRREFRTPSEAVDTAPRAYSDWRRLTSGGVSVGRAGAPVILTIFSDYQCPYCRSFAVTLRTFSARHPDSVRVIYHHYPIEAIHPFARDAAMAAECARDFGRFVQMNETLFDRQEQIGIASWGWFGAMAGLRDTAAFTACVRAQTDSQRIIADQRLGRSVPVRGTPTVFLNQWQLLGTPALALLDSVFARAIKPGQSKPY